MNAAELTRIASEEADVILKKVADVREAVLLCGLIAAKLAAGPGSNMPGETSNSFIKLMQQGYSAAMTIETAGRVVEPNRLVMGGVL